MKKSKSYYNDLNNYTPSKSYLNDDNKNNNNNSIIFESEKKDESSSNQIITQANANATELNKLIFDSAISDTEHINEQDNSKKRKKLHNTNTKLSLYKPQKQ